MKDNEKLMSDAFQDFMREAPKHSQAWMSAVQDLGKASVLDRRKPNAWADLAVLSVLNLESGIPFHVALAKEAGASREEVISGNSGRLARGGQYRY